ncbi:MAG: hypothetical protein KAX47_14720, partial [Zoogloea sp.]|nr:hypothetical protein [Zoogloea sp.]
MVADFNNWRFALPAWGPELFVPGSWQMSIQGGTATSTESPPGTLNLKGDGANAARADYQFTTIVGELYYLSVPVAGGGTGFLTIGTSQG